MLKIDTEFFWHSELLTDYSEYVGLKDKNNQEIFEGDIVEDNWTNKNRVIIGVIYWNKEKFSWWYRNKLTNCSIDNSISKLKIIGNIYENRELLNENSCT